jgi:hypothetical protein
VWSKALKARGQTTYLQSGNPVVSAVGSVVEEMRSVCVNNVKRAVALETAYGCARGVKLWRAEPHERIRHEIGPAGSGRTKASGGCENLKAQVVG